MSQSLATDAVRAARMLTFQTIEDPISWQLLPDKNAFLKMEIEMKMEMEMED